MRKYLSLTVATAFILSLFCSLAFGSDFPAEEASVSEVIEALGALIGGVKGASTLAIVALVGQLLTKFVLSPLWSSLKLDVKYKFLVFALSNLALAIVPLMMQGMSFLEALASGGILLLVVQYGHRIYELFFEKKEA